MVLMAARNKKTFDWFYWLDQFGEAADGVVLKLRPLGYTEDGPSSFRNNLIYCYRPGMHGRRCHRRRLTPERTKKAGKALGHYQPCASTGLEDPLASGTPNQTRVIAFCDGHEIFPTP
jgi:hypothetical protein